MHSLVLQKIYLLAKDEPNKLALSSGNDDLTYYDLAHEINEFASRLSPYRDQCLALEMDNSHEWVIADLACLAANVVSLPLPPFFTEEQHAHALIESGAKAVIGKNLAITMLDYHSVNFPVETNKITFTSGTTSQPKGVCLSQGAMEQVAISLLEVIGSSPAQKTAAILPLAVLLENIAGCYATLLAGGCYDIRPQAEIGLRANAKPDFLKLVHYLQKSEATSCILVPELLRGLMMALAQTGIRLPMLQFIAVGGSRASPKLLQKAQSLGLPVFQGYGLSECASVVAVNSHRHKKIESVGRPLPHINLKIAEDGEILVKHPAFLGYLGCNKPAEEYATGDIGHLDQEGYLHLTGRKKNVLINAYGRNISPEWPESELLSQPEILQAIVFGDAEPELSALIVPTNPALSHARLEAAVSDANARLPDYAQIKKWVVVPPFTQAEGLLTGTGRPKRAEIMQKYQQNINNEENHANIL